MQNKSSLNALLIEYDSLFGLSDPVYLKDHKGIYVDCNSAFIKRTGLSDKTALIGKSNHELLTSHDEITHIHQHEQDIMASEKPTMIIESLTLSNKTTQHLLAYKIPLKNTALTSGILTISLPMKNIQQLSNNIAELTRHQPASEEKNTLTTSKREKECLYHLIHGKTAKEIGRILNLSPRTIEFYIENMKKKFSCNNRIELIAKAYHILKI